MSHRIHRLLPLTVWMALTALTSQALPQNSDTPDILLNPVRLENLPAQTIAYVEQVGNFQANPEIYDVLIERILAWAIPEGRWDFPAKTQIVLVYPDGDDTPEDKQRLWFGITVDATARPPEGIHRMELPAGPHAVGDFLLTSDRFGEAWGYLYGQALPALNQVPADGYAFEIQLNDSSEHPEQKHRIRICVPVQPQE